MSIILIYISNFSPAISKCYWVSVYSRQSLAIPSLKIVFLSPSTELVKVNSLREFKIKVFIDSD